MAIRYLIAMNKESKIFVAGHRGLVGSAIVRQLLKDGYKHLVLRTREQLDLCNQAEVESFFSTEKIEYVFLAAAKVGGIHANDTYAAEFISANLKIQTNVIDAAYRNGVTKLLFLGSSCIYPKMAKQPLTEGALLTGTLEPTNEWYAIAKIAGIKMCQAYHKQYGFKAISLMPTNLYGPNDNFDLQSSHVLPALIRKFHLAKLVANNDFESIIMDEQKYGEIPESILNSFGVTRNEGNLQAMNTGTMVSLWGTGTPKREFLHVDDLASAALYLMNTYDDPEIINVGVGEDIMINDLAKMIKEVVGFEGEIHWDKTKPDGTPRKLMDIDKIKSLGWKPEIQLEAGINSVYEQYIVS